MKNMNVEKDDIRSGLKAKLANKAADLLIETGIDGCYGYFVYETEIPIEVLMSQKYE